MNASDAAGLAWVLGVGGGLGSIAVSAWLVFIIVDGYRRRQQVRSAADLQVRVLEKIGSAREFGEFLATDAGARFLDAIAVDRRVAYAGILRTLQAGVVALVLGGALLVTGARGLNSAGAAALGVVCAALGAGLLLASAFSYLAAKHMGLLTAASTASDRNRRP
jgi:hypothetical protein